MKMNMKKIWKSKFDFRTLHIKIRWYGTFHKNLRKKSFFKFFTWEGRTRTEVSKGLILNAPSSGLFPLKPTKITEIKILIPKQIAQRLPKAPA